MDDVLVSLLDTYKSDLKIRSKRIWGHKAKPHPDAHPAAPVITPVSFVYCSFNTKSPGSPDRDFIKELGPRPRTLKVIDALQSIRVIDFRNKFHNIRYNFMIGGDGVVYKGRGWFERPCLPMKHAYNCNQSLHIGFIGYWHDEPPDDKLFNLRDELIKIGVEKGIINKKYLLVTLAFPCVYRSNFGLYVR